MGDVVLPSVSSLQRLAFLFVSVKEESRGQGLLECAFHQDATDFEKVWERFRRMSG